MDFYIDDLKARIEALPQGYLSVKNIRGKKCVYYQWREGDKIRSRYVKAEEVEGLTRQIEEKKALKEELKKAKAEACHNDAECHNAALQLHDNQIRRAAVYASKIYMRNQVTVGEQDFETLITKTLFYVDKTYFIRDWWESNDRVTLITRPRRFGKTLTMSMVNCFFSVNYHDRGDLFERLWIGEEEKFRQMQGTFPVINLTFSSVKSMIGVKNTFRNLFAEEFRRHSYLLKSERLTEPDKKAYLSVNRESDPESVRDAMHLLSRLLWQHWQKKVIILLDEYDTPLQEAWAADCRTEVLIFLREFFNFTLKNNPWLERALITGITCVGRESIFSDLNNLHAVSVQTQKYETAFGFTEEEVFDAMDRQGLAADICKKQVKAWYDGFIFGKTADIYNPWSITCYLNEKVCKPFWANTSSDSLITGILAKCNPEIKDKLEDLLRGEEILVPIREELVYSQLDREESALWSLLAASGYLRINGETQENSGSPDDVLWGDEFRRVQITNLETRGAYARMIRSWFTDTAGNYNQFLKYLLQDDIDGMNVYLNQLLQHSISYFDCGDTRLEERFYHGLTLGMMVELQKEYEIRSNRESGFGRYDVMLIPRESYGEKDRADSKKNAYILEFKVFRPEREKSLKDTAISALEQIHRKNYAAELKDRGFSQKQIREIGLAFSGKEALIMEK